MINRPLPTEVYLDTSVFVGAIIRGAPHATACSAFCQQLIQAETAVYYSQLVRVELLQAIRRVATTQHNLPAATRTRYHLDRWGSDATVRRAWLQLGMVAFEALLNKLVTTVELPWTIATWQASAQLMIQHGLQASDALHVATAQEQSLSALAAVDDDYRRVPTLDFWLIRD